MQRDRVLIPLSHQHQHALALCVQIDRSLAAGAPANSIDVLARTLVEQFDSEMRSHFSKEEQVLFPAMSQFETTRELVTELVAEHRSMQTLRDTLKESPDKGAVAEFSAMLRLHVRKEEGVLFEEAQRLLTREQMDAIGKLLAPEV
jgi:hemerythrin-like domain-containing protein